MNSRKFSRTLEFFIAKTNQLNFTGSGKMIQIDRKQNNKNNENDCRPFQMFETLFPGSGSDRFQIFFLFLQPDII